MTLLMVGRALSSFATTAAILVTGLPQPPGEDGAPPGPNAVQRWNDTAREAALASCIAPDADPLHESRMYAMASLAVHDALNAIDPLYRPYALRAGRWHGASSNAAVAAAARTVLVSVIGDLPEMFGACKVLGIKVVEDAYAEALKAEPDGPAEDRGLAVGAAAAHAVIAERVGDGSDTPLIVSDYPQGTRPGEWRFTPDRPFAFAPGWAKVKTFGLHGKAGFRVAPAHRLGSRAYARDVAEIKALGGDGVRTPSARTPDQTEAALFWVESSPQQWNRIARQLAVARSLDSWRSARLFALLNMALADGYIASWAVKYRTPFWRPVTAIREAGRDGNPATTPDATWTPLATTPPIPDHDSAHAVEGGAAATVIAAVLGTDHVMFTACSLSLPEGQQCDDQQPTRRGFTSLWQAATENANSRVWVGFHFRRASEVGLVHGRKVARLVMADQLEPVRFR